MDNSLAYDFNFCFTVPDVLESDRVKIVPFIPSKHGEELYTFNQTYPEAFKWLPYGPFQSKSELFERFLEIGVRQDNGRLLLAVFDKTKSTSSHPDGALAGAIAYINSTPLNMAAEIGCVKIFPPFQRTHVASNAVGLLLKYALELPDGGGLGLRRVVWQANASNQPSIRLAQRMGFQLEGILRWDRALPEGKDDASNGKGVRAGDLRPKSVGRDSAMLSFCWDDWEGGGKEKVEAIMARLE